MQLKSWTWCWELLLKTLKSKGKHAHWGKKPGWNDTKSVNFPLFSSPAPFGNELKGSLKPGLRNECEQKHTQEKFCFLANGQERGPLEAEKVGETLCVALCCLSFQPLSNTKQRCQPWRWQAGPKTHMREHLSGQSNPGLKSIGNRPLFLPLCLYTLAAWSWRQTRPHTVEWGI